MFIRKVQRLKKYWRAFLVNYLFYQTGFAVYKILFICIGKLLFSKKLSDILNKIVIIFTIKSRKRTVGFNTKMKYLAIYGVHFMYVNLIL